jgi:hypothetical protein
MSTGAHSDHHGVLRPVGIRGYLGHRQIEKFHRFDFHAQARIIRPIAERNIDNKVLLLQSWQNTPYY